MRSRPHIVAMLAAAAMSASAHESLGVQRMALPALNLPSLPMGGGGGKPGKHRRSGTGSKRWRGSGNADKPHCGAKQAAKYARQAVTHDINQHYNARMRWNETVYPRVRELQERQREMSLGTRRNR